MAEGAILVSGGSRGLGLEIVSHLLACGHMVGSFARGRTVPVAELERRFPNSFAFAESDCCDQEATAEFVSLVQRRFGELRGLINNAAVGQDGFLANTAVSAIQEIVAVNLVAPLLLTRLVVREMLLQPNGGRIVNISSVCALRGFGGLTVYSATKAALVGFTRSLAREVGGRGILVNSIAPGFFESEMSSGLSQEDMGVIQRRTPTGRLTAAADLLPVVDLLLFGEINMTGQVISVDGGAGC